MSFIKCDKCGCTLVERKTNGIWRFRFGKYKKEESIVDMEVQGSIRIKCLKKSCRHVNVLNYLPNF